MLKQTVLLLALLAVLVLPFALRPARTGGKADDTLVIISPHNEAIRYEFALPFIEAGSDSLPAAAELPGVS